MFLCIIPYFILIYQYMVSFTSVHKLVQCSHTSHWPYLLFTTESHVWNCFSLLPRTLVWYGQGSWQ